MSPAASWTAEPVSIYITTLNGINAPAGGRVRMHILFGELYRTTTVSCHETANLPVDTDASDMSGH